ncbi:MAG TPA: hypothetical protein VGD78_18270 [Chthoniobacterales bacterium]
MRIFVLLLSVLSMGLNACKNETADGTRWDQIAADQKSQEKVQPWREASTPWSGEHYAEGAAW